MISSPPPDDRQVTTDKIEDLQELYRLCRQGMLYEVEGWIQDGRPLQIAPAVRLRAQYRSALGIAVETGQQSLCVLLLRSGYRMELERTSPLNIALARRRWELLDLLLEHGADPQHVSLTALFDTYRLDLFER